MDFKFIIAADIHLDSPMQGLSRYEGGPWTYSAAQPARPLRTSKLQL